MLVSVKTRVRATSETVVGDTEVQYQRHQARRVRKVGSQLNMPTMSTPAFSNVLRLGFMCGAEEVSRLLNHPVMRLLGTRMSDSNVCLKKKTISWRLSHPGVLHLHGDLKNEARPKILHHRIFYGDRPDLIVLKPRWTENYLILTEESETYQIPLIRFLWSDSSDQKESDQFRFLRAACLALLKGSVGLLFIINRESES